MLTEIQIAETQLTILWRRARGAIDVKAAEGHWDADDFIISCRCRQGAGGFGAHPTGFCSFSGQIFLHWASNLPFWRGNAYSAIVYWKWVTPFLILQKHEISLSLRREFGFFNTVEPSKNGGALSNLTPCLLNYGMNMRSEYSDLKWCVCMINWQGEMLCWLIFIVNLTEFRSTHETHSWVCLWRHLLKDLGAGKTLSESGRYHNMNWHLELNWNENVNRMLIFPSLCFLTLDTVRLAATSPQHHAFLVIMNCCLKLWAQINRFSS